MQIGRIKQVGRRLIYMHQKRGDEIFMREHALKIYYGDADSDMRSALEVVARPIRVLRAPNSTYLPPPKNGSFGEELIVDFAY